MEKLKKIVIIGPESTGKSTLCEQLAQHFDTSWCPEYAREYLHTHGKEYKYTDLINIAKGQIALEEEYALSLQNKLSLPIEKIPSNLLFLEVTERKRLFPHATSPNQLSTGSQNRAGTARGLK